MARSDNGTRRSRISIDVSPDFRRRIRQGAASRDLTVRQYLVEAIEARLHEDLNGETELALTATNDPVLAELWDNARDAEYDRL
jgi:hypothetical protein